MTSSGIKRGVAVTAVAALTCLGLPTLASAQDVGQGQGTFELYSQYSGGASTRNDGNNTTVTLLAGVPDGAGAVQVRFSYMKGATPVVIDNVVPIDGVATMEWTPPTGAERDAITAVRAETLNASNVVLATDDNPIVGATIPTNQAAHLNGALRSSVGIGPDNEIVVSGNVTTAGVTVTARGPEAVVGGGSSTVGTPDANNVRPFTAVVPLGANNTPDATDEIVVGAASDAPASDDVNVYTAYQQTVTNANVAPSSATVQAGGPVDDSSYVFTVTDQNGAAVQGLDIYESRPNGGGFVGEPFDGNGRDAAGNPSAGGETGTDGKLTVKLRESDIDNGADQDATANTQATFYVVDVNQDGDYDNGLDYIFRISQTRVTAVPTTVEITSAKGQAIDDDETTLITLTVKDQNGTPIQGVTPQVTVTSDNQERQNNTAAQPGADYVDPKTSNPAVGATNAQGQTTFTLDPEDAYRISHKIEAYVNNNGTPQADAGDAVAAPLTVVSDTSSIVWANGDISQAKNGTTTTQNGTLALDGLPAGERGSAQGLSGRTVTVSYSPADNSVLAPQAQQPAGTTRLSDTTATVVTGANGAFGVAVTDPATPDGQELNSTLTADFPAGNAGDRFDDFDADGIEDAFERSGDFTDASIEIDFLRSVAVADLRIINPDTNTEADGLVGLMGTTLVPGGLGVGFVEAFNSDGVELTDVSVSLTIDEGHFVDIDSSPFENAAPGAPLDFVNDGKTITVNTGDLQFGDGTFYSNIERNAGFDDDGEVDDNIDASAGSVSDGHDLTWTTNATPLNPRANNPLVVELSEDQDSSILPKARAGDPDGYGQTVDFDVMTFDQFENPTRQELNTSDNTPVASFFGGGSSQFMLGQPAIEAFADEATNQVLEVELDGAVRTVYTDDPETSEFDPENPGLDVRTVSADIEEQTDAINWYDVDFDASTFSMDQSGAQTVPVGTTVTEVLSATDQEGQALDGLCIDFLRGGPGDEDSDGNNFDVTDADGEAFYDFVGGSRGTATITAVAYENSAGFECTGRIGNVATDTVNFGDGGSTNIDATLRGRNTGADTDKLKVVTNPRGIADGAVVNLYKFNKNGVRVLVESASLNANGVKRFQVKDSNGRKFTKYVARVKRTDDSSAVKRTNFKRVR